MICKILISCFLFLNIAILIHGEHRNISFFENKECLVQKEWNNCTALEIDCTEPWLIYGKGVTTNNSVHYLWGLKEFPTFVLMTAIVKASIKIDWCLFQQHLPGAISLSEKPHNMFGISFQNLILFDDKNDTGRIDDIPADFQHNISLSLLTWKFNLTSNLTSSFESDISSFNSDPLDDGKISITIKSFADADRMTELPHLLTTSSSTKIDILLDNLMPVINNETLKGYKSPRWAIDMIVISDEEVQDEEVQDKEVQDKGFLYTARKSLDDEYTPGVFDLISLTTLNARMSNSTSNKGGFLQWRPVCYLDTDDNINYSTYPNFQLAEDDYLKDIDKEHKDNATMSLFYSMFGNSMNKMNQGQTIISFGLTDDGFYTKYKYTKWTMSMGLGAVPEESFSNLVIIVICVGVGVPFIIFLISGVYFGVKKIKKNRREDTTSLIDSEE